MNKKLSTKSQVAKGIADARNVAMYQLGTELGAACAEADVGIVKADWIAALKRVKVPADRVALRAGFVDVYTEALTGELGAAKAKVSANSRFDYLARLYGKPSASRKAKSNAKKKRSGRPPADGDMGGKHIPPADVALRLAAVLHYVATCQQNFADDEDMMEVLADIAAIAAGKTAKHN